MILSVIGLVLIILGTLVLFGFQTAPSDEGQKIDPADFPLLGSSVLARMWNEILVPRFFGIRFVTRGVPESEHRAMTIRMEKRLWWLGAVLLILGCLLQLLVLI